MMLVECDQAGHDDGCGCSETWWKVQGPGTCKSDGRRQAIHGACPIESLTDAVGFGDLPDTEAPDDRSQLIVMGAFHC
jgi:hypothetical protein